MTPRLAVEEVTRLYMTGLAKIYHCEDAYRSDQQRSGFKAAFANYHAALCQWVDKLTPPELARKLEQFETVVPLLWPKETKLAFERQKYLVQRAFFVAGMKCGKGYEAGHYRLFALMGADALRFDDDSVFESARQRKWNYRPRKEHGKTTNDRKLKYMLLIAWLPGGFWRMDSRAEQMCALKRFFPDLPAYSLGETTKGSFAIAKAQERLGLRWPVKS